MAEDMIPQEVRILLSMEPTREDLTRYLQRIGKEQGYVQVVNIFASHPVDPQEQIRFDLCKDRAGFEGAQLVAIYAGPSAPEGALRSGYDYQDWQHGAIAPEAIEPWKRHNEAIERASADLAGCWQRTLQKYAAPLTWISNCAALYLDPHPSLPFDTLITALADHADLRCLILLTARQELGYLAGKLSTWAERQHGLSSELPFSQKDMALITARARRRGLWGQGIIADKDLGAIAALTVRGTVEPGLGALYWRIGEYAQKSHTARLKIRRCTHCSKPLPARNGAGAPSLYCGACRKTNRQRQNREAQARLREREGQNTAHYRHAGKEIEG